MPRDIQTNRATDRQMDIQIDRQADKYTDNQTNIHTDRTHCNMAAADFIFTFLLLLLFANRPFPIVDSVLRMVPSDNYLSLSSFFISPSTKLVWQPVSEAIRPSPCMCRMECCWLWVRPFGSVPFRPCHLRSRQAALFASDNVEANPGPLWKHLIRLGSFNIRSGLKKAAVLHDIISDRRLDVLVIQESWIPSEAPAAIKNDMAPVGYTALYVQRELRPDGPKRRDGLAVLHRNSLAVWDFCLPTGSIQPKAFEMQLVRITSSNSRSVVPVNIIDGQDVLFLSS